MSEFNPFEKYFQSSPWIPVSKKNRSILKFDMKRSIIVYTKYISYTIACCSNVINCTGQSQTRQVQIQYTPEVLTARPWKMVGFGRRSFPIGGCLQSPQIFTVFSGLLRRTRPNHSIVLFGSSSGVIFLRSPKPEPTSSINHKRLISLQLVTHRTAKPYCLKSVGDKHQVSHDKNPFAFHYTGC